MNENTMELVEMDDIEETEYEPEDNEKTESTDEGNGLFDAYSIAMLTGAGIVGALIATKGPKVVKKIGGAANSGLKKVKNILPGKKHHKMKPVQEDEVVEETVEEETE